MVNAVHQLTVLFSFSSINQCSIQFQNFLMMKAVHELAKVVLFCLMNTAAVSIN
jgi:hypothetical protein